VVPKRAEVNDKSDRRPKNLFSKRYLLKEGEQPKLGQSDQFKLMPFQVSTVIFSRFPHSYTALRSTGSIGCPTIGGIISRVSLLMRWVLYGCVIYDVLRKSLNFVTGEDSPNLGICWQYH